MKRLLSYISMVWLLMSCGPSHSSEEKVSYYRDIDHFKLEGLGEIGGPVTYPYYKLIDSSGSRRTLVIVPIPQDSITIVYRKKDGYWVSAERNQGTTSYGSMIMYTYLLPGRIVTLNFKDSAQSLSGSPFEKYQLLSIGITTISSDEIYHFENKDEKIFITPSPFAADSVDRSKATNYRLCNMRIDGDALVENCATLSGGVEHHETHCYDPVKGSLQKDNLWALRNPTTARSCG